VEQNDIWHDVCTECHPNLDMAICGTVITHDPDSDEKLDISDGQDCVVCMGMMCVTCPPGIIGKISPQTKE
jgi:hypothetical protein